MPGAGGEGLFLQLALNHLAEKIGLGPGEARSLLAKLLARCGVQTESHGLHARQL